MTVSSATPTFVLVSGGGASHLAPITQPAEIADILAATFAAEP